ncbi:MAG: FGGY family carbohydrate kinase [Cyclobacteriaceae bacterium]
MSVEVTLIFDIGKTNKKLYVLDDQLKELHKEYVRFDEIVDDDGFPCDDLEAIAQWVLASAKAILSNDQYEVKSINFSTYGASMVHLDQSGKVIAPFYNYLKPYPEDLKQQFFSAYHGEANFSLITASPSMGFLNSGMQLYYLKYCKPHLFDKLSVSLHFPQYLSYLLTGRLTSDYTSVGCHTGLWDFRNHDYAQWINEESLEQYLPKPEPTLKLVPIQHEDQVVHVGIGIHDSSAALVPYLRSAPKPFVLISTGTWSICMNPFNEHQLTKDELANDCLTFMSTTGSSVKASRLFLGQELREQAMRLGEYFEMPYHRYKEVSYDKDFEPLGSGSDRLIFSYTHLDVARFGKANADTEDFSIFRDFDHAYHQLMHEMTNLQINSLSLAIGESSINDIFIDGGFADNEIFVQMLADKLPQYRMQSVEFALGSSLGAALVVNSTEQSYDGLSDSYKPRVHLPVKKSSSHEY